MSLAQKTLRVMTYNVHSCIGKDSEVSTFRIAQVISDFCPDIVALQELDAGKARTNHSHQAQEISEHLNMDFHFHPSIEIEDEKYGNAILSRLPIRLVQAGGLPAPHHKFEKRGAMWASVYFNGLEVQVINTHLGLNSRERLAQAETLLGQEWAAHSSCRPPVIICGDLNAMPFTRTYKRFGKAFLDAQLSNGSRPKPTYPSLFPLARIDHIFTSSGLIIEKVHVPSTGVARVASDHLPVIVDISFPGTVSSLFETLC